MYCHSALQMDLSLKAFVFAARKRPKYLKSPSAQLQPMQIFSADSFTYECVLFLCNRYSFDHRSWGKSFRTTGDETIFFCFSLCSKHPDQCCYIPLSKTVACPTSPSNKHLQAQTTIRLKVQTQEMASFYQSHHHFLLHSRFARNLGVIMILTSLLSIESHLKRSFLSRSANSEKRSMHQDEIIEMALSTTRCISLCSLEHLLCNMGTEPIKKHESRLKVILIQANVALNYKMISLCTISHFILHYFNLSVFITKLMLGYLRGS